MKKKILLTQILQQNAHILQHVLQLGIDISKVQKQLKKIIMKQEQLDAVLTEINDATNAISARLQALIDAGADNVTQASLDALQADADALKAIGTPPETT